MKVAICTPVYEHVSAAYAVSLANLLLNVSTEHPDVELRYLLSRGHLIPNRNEIAAAALEWGADRTLWIDADTLFPKWSLTLLLSRGKRVIGCNVATRSHPPKPTAFRHIGPSDYRPVQTTLEIARRAPVEQVDHIGLGLTLIASDVLRKVGCPIFRAEPDDGTGVGDDVGLCRRIRDVGEQIFVDHALSLDIGHVGQAVYRFPDCGMRSAEQVARG